MTEARRLIPPVAAGLIGVVAALVGVGFPVRGPLPLPLRLAGLVPIGAGGALLRSARAEFTRVGATIGTFDNPIVFVTAGPFSHSRNPMYLGMVLVLSGLAIGIGSLTAWVAPVGFVLLSDRWYIPYEERSLQERFGTTYALYKARVARWYWPIGRMPQSR